jgi:hypothetical protein
VQHCASTDAILVGNPPWTLTHRYSPSSSPTFDRPKNGLAQELAAAAAAVVVVLEGEDGGRLASLLVCIEMASSKFVVS